MTHSKPSAFPSSLRAKLSEVQTLTEDDMQTDATIRQTCEKCGREEVRYYTQQLRSADEGSTVFYTCDCGHKYGFLVVVLERMLMFFTGGIPTTKRNSLLLAHTLVSCFHINDAFHSDHPTIYPSIKYFIL